MNLISKIVLIVFLLLFLSSGTKAQNVCPPDTGFNCTPWSSSMLIKNTTDPTCVITVFYRWRFCDTQYQIYVDSVQRIGDCTYLDENWNNQDYSSSFQDWINVIVVEDIVDESAQPWVNYCPDTTMKALFYTASCGVWVKCTYNVDSTSIVCDQGWIGPYPGYYLHGGSGPMKVDYWQWQSCGLTCCKKVYGLCITSSTSQTGYDIHMTLISTQKLQPCSDQGNYNKPCTDGC